MVADSEDPLARLAEYLLPNNRLYIWDAMRENLTLFHANNNGTDQPAHLHSLISAFVIYLNSCSIYNFNNLASPCS